MNGLNWILSNEIWDLSIFPFWLSQFCILHLVHMPSKQSIFMMHFYWCFVLWGWDVCVCIVLLSVWECVQLIVNKKSFSSSPDDKAGMGQLLISSQLNNICWTQVFTFTSQTLFQAICWLSWQVNFFYSQCFTDYIEWWLSWRDIFE